MRAIWLLSTNALWGRPSRTLLLSLAVALAATLIVCVGGALESIMAGLDSSIAGAIGKADLRIKRVGEDRFEASTLELVRGSPHVSLIAPRLDAPVVLRNPRVDPPIVQQALGHGVAPAEEPRVSELRVASGSRLVERDDEVVLDRQLAGILQVKPGDTVQAIGLSGEREVKVVGVLAERALEIVRKPQAWMSIPTLEAASGIRGKLNEIALLVDNPAQVKSIAKGLSDQLPKDMLAEPTAPITSGVRAKASAARLVFLLGSVLNFVAAAFIVLTGLTTNLLERQRELAVMRCIGATRGQLFAAQLTVGSMIGAMGAAAGVPLGVGLTWLLTVLFPERMPAGMKFSAIAVGAGLGGSVIAGLVGAAWPAWRASRVRPLKAMASHLSRVRARTLVLIGVASVLMVSLPAAWLFSRPAGFNAVQPYVAFGVPSVFVGYFLLSVPVLIGCTALLSPVVSRVLGLPKNLLRRTIMATPLRNGFTAGSLMVGLAIMTDIWTGGASILHGFLGSFRFPDAFVQSWTGLTPEVEKKIEGLEFVERTCPITLLPVDTKIEMGIKGLGTRKTSFIAFEPDAFFAMTNLVWDAGDPEYAKKRLKEGGAVIVAKEFLVANRGVQLGGKFPIKVKGQWVDFEEVGAVSSPRLDVMNAGFDIGKKYAEQAVLSVFGSRDDLKRVFGSEAIHLIQVSLKLGTSDEQAEKGLRGAAGLGAMIGSGRAAQSFIESLGAGTLRLATLVAIGAMLIGCAGVANIVVAGVAARRFEFGVLRAVGAARGLVTRLVLGEVLILAVSACIVGTTLGLQGSASQLRVNRLLLGIEAPMRILPEVIALGWGILLVLVLVSVWPVLARLGRTPVRELVGGRG